MYALKVYTVALLCLCGILASCANAAVDARWTSNNEVIEFVETHTQDRLAALVNYRCTQTIAPASDFVVPIRRTLYIDRQERGRIRISDGWDVTTIICNGDRTIELRENSEPNSPSTYTASIVSGMQNLVQVYNDPWRYMGGTLLEELTRIRDEEGRLRIIKIPTGHYRLDIRSADDNERVLILDPSQGYVPIERKTIVDGNVESHETITFEEVEPNMWFPVQVHSTASTSPARRSSQDSTLKYTFTNVTVNYSSFERALSCRFPVGTEVTDRVSGEYYVVGSDIRKPLEKTAAANAAQEDQDTEPETKVEPWRKAFEAKYRLEADGILKFVATPFIPERIDYLFNAEPDLRSLGKRGIQRRLYLFEWGQDSIALERLSEHRSIDLSAMLENIVQLSSYEYEGPTYLLNLRLAGDWVVRKNTSPAQRLDALEQILEQETRKSITFIKDSTQDVVMRATGTCQFRPLANAPDPASIFVYAGNWDARQGNSILSTGTGTTAALLDRVGNAIGMPILDQTTPSNQPLRWMLHESSMLREIKNASDLYNPRLGTLFGALSSQTGLTFTPVIGTHSVWHVTTQRALAAEAD